MKFEEALGLLRKGSKIRHPAMEEGYSYIFCFVGIKKHFLKEGEENFKIPDIALLDSHGDWLLDSKKTYHLIRLVDLLRDDWEVLETEIKSVS